MKKLTLSEKIILVSSSLKALTEKAFYSEEGKKEGVTLTDKVLLFVSSHEGGVKPRALMDEFLLQKSNLATLCSDLCLQGYLTKVKDNIDGRTIKYMITDSGSKYLSHKTSKIEEKANRLLTETEIKLLENSLDIIIDKLRG